MIYYIDAYNLIFGFYPDLLDESFDPKQAVERLLKQVQGESLRLVFVFDAYKTPSELSRLDYGSVELVYTYEGQKADDYMLQVLKSSSLPQEVVIITNDKALGAQVRALKGKHLFFSDFFDLFQKKDLLSGDSKTTQNFDSEDFNYYLQTFSSHFKKK